MGKNLQFLLLILLTTFSANTFAQDLIKDYTYVPDGAPRVVAKEQLLNNSFVPNQNLTDAEKCATVEVNKMLKAKYPQLGSIEGFEEWMEAKVIERRNQNLTERDPGEIYRLPYVVHIIHDNDPINTPGNVVGANISAAQVASQIRVLNEDFRKMNADRANSPEWDSVAADMDIEFVPALRDPETGIPLDEPGIHRVNRNDLGLPALPYSIDEMEDLVKPATSWDWEKVANIWVTELTPGGLYGYAQFPSQSGLPGFNPDGGPADTDGVVTNLFAFGSTADDDGSFTTAGDLFGRTLTHEFGHWAGLRHIWGDGNCSADDFVEDTPRMIDNSPFNSCNANQNTCDDTLYGAAVDLPDMNENFMDYSSDSCMNLFTVGQKERVDVVFENSPGRGILLESDVVDEVDAELGFFPNVFSSYEGNSLTTEEECLGYKDIEVRLYLLGDATGGTPTVSVELSDETTATEGEDFELLTENLDFTFDDGSAATKLIMIRVYDDALLEGDEKVVFEAVNFDADGSDAQLTQKFFTLDILDDDFEPSNANVSEYLAFENFEGGFPDDLTLTSIVGGGVNNFTVGDGATPPMESMSMYASGNGTDFSYNARPSAWNLAYFPLASFEGNQGTLSFDWSGIGESFSFFGFLFPYDWGQVGFINEEFTTIYYVTDLLLDQPDLQNLTIDVPFEFTQGNWYLTFSWENDGSVAGETSIAYDNIELKQEKLVEFETEVTGDGSAYVNIPGNSTVHVYSKESVGRELIASIVNSSDHDYGCTKVEVDRAGDGFKFYENTCENELALGKTVFITPENESEEMLTVSLYYTVGEISTWEAQTGLELGDMYMTHADTAIASLENGLMDSQIEMATTEMFNNYGYGFTASFDANLGGGYGIVPPSSNGIGEFTAVQNEEQIDINISILFQSDDVDYYLVEKSSDNVTWEEFKVIPNTMQDSYSLIDYNPTNGGNFYRVVSLESSCGPLTSDEVYVNYIPTNEAKVFPNPATDQITLTISNGEIYGATSIGIFDSRGQLVIEENVNIGDDQGVYRQMYDISNLAAGQYYVKAIGVDGEVLATFVKVEN